jgi:predicted peroxiredoxin
MRELAAGLANGKAQVTLFLVQNGVQAARTAAPLRELMKTGVRVRADEFSLKERGISSERLAPGIAPAPIELVIDELAAGARVLWF